MASSCPMFACDLISPVFWTNCFLVKMDMVNRYVIIQTNKQTNKQTDRQTDRQTGWQTDGRTESNRHAWMDG